MTNLSLPVLSDSGLSRYLEEIRKFPMLDEQEEYMLAKAWVDRGDVEAAHKLVTSHLRLAAKIAMGYRGYGLALADLISEGNVGLMQAVKKFEPDRGFRLSTYAMWWIKAAIQEFVLRSWSLVKMGTTAAQKKLFFNLRQTKNRILTASNKSLTPEQVKQIADELAVPELDVVEMEQRMSGSDRSLNSAISADNESEWMDYLEDQSESHETVIAENEDLERRKLMLTNSMKKLNERERDIVNQRLLKDNPTTLEELSQKYNISRERVRQIESRALEKLQKDMLSAYAA